MSYVPARARFGLGAYVRRRRGFADYSTGLLVDTSAVPDQNACTCRPDGTCAENGNSCSYVGPTSGTPAPPVSGSQSLTQWLNANINTVLIGGAALFGLALMGGGRRR